MAEEQETVLLGTVPFRDALHKKVGSAKKGKVGIVYLPKDWVGSEVTVIRRSRE